MDIDKSRSEIKRYIGLKLDWSINEHQINELKELRANIKSYLDDDFEYIESSFINNKLLEIDTELNCLMTEEIDNKTFIRCMEFALNRLTDEEQALVLDMNSPVKQDRNHLQMKHCCSRTTLYRREYSILEKMDKALIHLRDLW